MQSQVVLFSKSQYYRSSYLLILLFHHCLQFTPAVFNRRIQPTPPPRNMLHTKRQAPKNLNIPRIQRQRNLSTLAPLNQLNNALRHLSRRDERPEELARRVYMLEHLGAHLPWLHEYSLDFLGARCVGEFGAQREVQSEERGFGGAVCGEVCGAHVAQHGRDCDDGAAAFGEHVREEGSERREVRHGVYAEGLLDLCGGGG